MNNPHSHLDLLIVDALNRDPEMMFVFLRFHTGCIGCLMASFCTLGSAVKMHNLQDTTFLTEVEMILNKNDGDPAA